MGEVWLTILWVVLGILGGVVALAILWLLFVMVVGWFVSEKKIYRTRSKFHCFLYDVSLHIAMWLCRVKVHLTGGEKIPENTRFLLVSNHVSNYDSLATSKVLGKYELGIISKPSNFKMPFFGRLVRRCCYFAIDRENIRNAAKTINLAAEVMKADECSMLVYPEGTRNKKAEGLLPFHNMVFKIAQRADAPIVVMTVRNSQAVHKRTPFRRTDVYIHILEVFSAEDVKEMRTEEIGEKVRQLMLKDEEEYLESKKA